MTSTKPLPNSGKGSTPSNKTGRISRVIGTGKTGLGK